MIQIAGTDYEQPTDKAVVSYDTEKHVLISEGDLIQRVEMSEIQEAGQPVEEHDHEEETLAFRRTNFPPSGAISIGDSAGGSISIVEASGTVKLYGKDAEGMVNLTGYVQVWGVDGIMYISLMGTVGQRNARADAWYLYACSILDKENVAPITAPLARVRQATGITFTQDGFDNVGISAEDLDAIGLPGLTLKDENGKYEGVNPVGIIPLLLEAIKELENTVISQGLRIDALEGV